MMNNKKPYNSSQFIPKTIAQQQNSHITPGSQNGKKNDTKLTYDEIRKLVEHRNEKEISSNLQEKQIKNKFTIV
jgi:hypothetical protein